MERLVVINGAITLSGIEPTRKIERMPTANSSELS